MEHNQQGGPRRGHFHRGRRGAERRGHERRQTPPESQSQPPAARGNDHVDVEQIMREIRSRIAQRHGIELSNQQVQELAARRLEAILDPRTVKPALLEQLRKSAGAPAVDPMSVPEPEPSYSFEESTLFDSHRGLLRFIRTLLKPILKLFFNPNPLIKALNTQSKLNAAATAREQERDRRQAEWNALHYELLQRVVTETARVSLELQALSLKVESLAGKVDFNERRVRSIEGAQASTHTAARQPSRVSDVPSTGASATATAISPQAGGEGASAGPGAQPSPQGDAQRKRRRRRRGRRGGGAATDEAAPNAGATSGDIDDGEDADGAAGDDGLSEDQGDQLEPEPRAVADGDATPVAQEPSNDVAAPALAQSDVVPAATEPPAENASTPSSGDAPDAPHDGAHGGARSDG
jgi:hypothetical protein